VNYVFQRHVTHGLPITDEALRGVIDLGQRHVAGLEQHSNVPLRAARFFEFGAGWDIHVAQVLYCFGANHQLVVDLRELLRPELVLDIRDRLATIDIPLPRRPPLGHTSIAAYLSAIGVDYRAPCDARATGLAAGSVDFATSTNTLEHIPEDDIPHILNAAGAMSFQIDYKDHVGARSFLGLGRFLR
jgi:hypothetical protein